MPLLLYSYVCVWLCFVGVIVISFSAVRGYSVPTACTPDDCHLRRNTLCCIMWRDEDVEAWILIYRWSCTKTGWSRNTKLKYTLQQDAPECFLVVLLSWPLELRHNNRTALNMRRCNITWQWNCVAALITKHNKPCKYTNSSLFFWSLTLRYNVLESKSECERQQMK
jgi:hypothetical protein